MVKKSSILTRKTGEWGEYFKKNEKIKPNAGKRWETGSVTRSISWLTTLLETHVFQEMLSIPLLSL